MHNMAGTKESQWLKVQGNTANTSTKVTASVPAAAPPTQMNLSSAAQRMMAMRYANTVL